VDILFSCHSLVTCNVERGFAPAGALQKGEIWPLPDFARMALQSRSPVDLDGDGIEPSPQSSLMPTFDIDGDHYARAPPGEAGRRHLVRDLDAKTADRRRHREYRTIFSGDITGRRVAMPCDD